MDLPALTSMADPTAGDRCPRCGVRFTCGMTAGESRCWCMDMPLVSPEAGAVGCYCPDCLKALAAEQKCRA